MLTAFLCTMGVINLLLWLINYLIFTSPDPNGKWVILFCTVPISCFVTTMSLIVAGWML